MSIRFEIYDQQDLAALARKSATHGQRYLWLQQYYLIREHCFRKELGINDFDGSEDTFDRTGYILLAIAGDRCIGGARLNSSTPTNPSLLPLEEEGFMLLKAFPQLAGEAASYCQWTRLAVLEEFRSVEVNQRIAGAMVELSVQLGHDYSFNVTGSNRARFYRRLHRTLGYQCEIRQDVELPVAEDFAGLEHLLSVVYLRQPVSAPVAESLMLSPELVTEPMRDVA